MSLYILCNLAAYFKLYMQSIQIFFPPPGFMRTWRRDLASWAQKSFFPCWILPSCPRTPFRQGRRELNAVRVNMLCTHKHCWTLFLSVSNVSNGKKPLTWNLYEHMYLRNFICLWNVVIYSNPTFPKLNQERKWRRKLAAAVCSCIVGMIFLHFHPSFFYLIIKVIIHLIC